ncbi:hypothetical protein GUITHDRAFT_156109 [Guillardia theta CCMP2712]|uniref:Uncharacterized protein n=1 Tax=Guillardia theta (strain CCMP2712) TaxID=905079 RepID=L1IAZ2_GUITC|nr:hypothetical protein GUITHDRAFT_156109 [Guillardia theta CCMP2712]EKX33257.1 hypothetical protein GUITHDRAFT_156109 [Guillardia theta CCMP2712]|mmetsp:Transcript_44426/g.140191  ORF Transcript_44426/g.140191 Transcript_44426/m.140191 type:complete len:126 (-) Transcript_44426:3317-3694(-)|eukprot:XP_005820237.1 hypothetical protein GUITHDRAFT_156109 [Guillardia theta CCMP2712]
METLAEDLPVIVDFSGCPDATCEDMFHALRAQDKITVLRLDGCKNITCEDVRRALPLIGGQLEELSIAHCTNLSGDELSELFCSEFPLLQTLNVSGCEQFSPGHLAKIVFFRNMKNLSQIRIMTG